MANEDRHPSKVDMEEALSMADNYKVRYQIQIDKKILAEIIKDVADHSYNHGWDDCMAATEKGGDNESRNIWR